MGSVTTQLAIYAIGGCLVGGLIGWSIQFARSKRLIGRVISASQGKLQAVAGQRDDVANKYSRLKAKVEQLESVHAQRSAEFEAALHKSKKLSKNVRILRKERENTKKKLLTLQKSLAYLKQQTSDLQNEFRKAQKFYKRELLKSLKQRKELEEELSAARAEQEAFARAVEASVLEHGSEENMVIAAQLRLGQLEVLERNVNKLEAENEQLRRDVNHWKEQFAAREKALADVEELRMHNRQLVQCVEALEDSRQAHEADAERYRQQADESEELSDTLRMRLDDLEKNFADMEKQQHEAIEGARKAAVVPILRKQG